MFHCFRASLDRSMGTPLKKCADPLLDFMSSQTFPRYFALYAWVSSSHCIESSFHRSDFNYFLKIFLRLRVSRQRRSLSHGASELVQQQCRHRSTPGEQGSRVPPHGPNNHLYSSLYISSLVELYLASRAMSCSMH